MKLFIALLALVPTVYTAAALATPKSVACGTHEKNIADNAQDLFNQGALSKIELIREQLKYQKAQAACGTLSQADYCTGASKTANDLIDGTQKAVDAGTVEPVELDKVIVEMTATIAPCTL